MALRFSPALTNFIADRGSWKDFLDNGSIEIYSGSQPATPDLAVTGTLGVTITNGSASKTSEVKATGVLTLSGTTSGSVDTLTLLGVSLLGGSVAYNTSLTQTAADVCTKINRNPKNKLVVASNVGAVITLTVVPGFGTLLNSAALTITSTTLTSAVTSTSFGSGTGGSVAGVNAANGLTMDFNAAAGVFTKNTTETWSGVAAASITAGWFRYISSIADAGALDSSAVYLRMDGNIATSGANLNMSSTTITSGATQTLSTFSLTIPAA